jgi:hypothetical protein
MHAHHHSRTTTHPYTCAHTHTPPRFLHHFEGDARYNIAGILQAETIAEVDDQLTRITFGHGTLNDYYRSASSAPYIKHIRTPTLFLSALDDPLVHEELVPTLEIAGNPNCLLVVTRRGGHIGWFTGLDGGQWHTPALVEYVVAMARTLEIPPPAQKAVPPATRRPLPRSLGTSREDLPSALALDLDLADPTASGPGSRTSSPSLASPTLTLQRRALSTFWWVRFLSRSAKFLLFALITGIFHRRFKRG